jgi:hypothetical protein
MKFPKDLRVSIECFNVMLASETINTRQREAVRQAKAQLMKLARKRNVTADEAQHFVRVVSELLVVAFIKMDDEVF